MADATMAHRRRPLFTCGASTLTIIWNLYRRALEMNGSIGSGTRRLAKLGSRASPLVCVVQYQWLSILWFVDGFILSMEKIFERCVPPSRHVFDKMDNIIDKVDNLTRDFELLMNKLPVIIEEIPFLRYTKEKEIRVDASSNGEKREDDDDTAKTTRDEAVDHNNNNRIVMSSMKCSYKEPLEKGVKEEEKTEQNVNHEGVEEHAKGNENEEDPLLELFDFGWETPKARLTILRSASYT